MSRLGCFTKQFDDGSQPLMADDNNRSGGKMLPRGEPAKQDEVPVLQRRDHAEPRYTDDPEAQQRANALNQVDQSTG